MNITKYITLNFDWTRTKNKSWDNQWKSTFEIFWNKGLPIFFGILTFNANKWFVIPLLIIAYFDVELERNRS